MTTTTTTTLSNKFAYLPNGIIRDIMSYAGISYKKRNGKYMGQIPRNDERYTLLSKLNKIVCFTYPTEPDEYWTYYYSSFMYEQAALKREMKNFKSDLQKLKEDVQMYDRVARILVVVGGLWYYFFTT